MSSIFFESENFDFKNSEASISHCQNISQNSDNPRLHQHQNLLASLNLLIASMKPSFLKKDNNFSLLRQIIFAKNNFDAMILLKKSSDAVLIGTGFSEIISAGKNYFTFPDIRLPFSEKENINGWILTHTNFDTKTFFLVLEALDFPKIFAPHSVISYIRDHIFCEKILDKIRFSPIFSAQNFLQIGSHNFYIFEKNSEKFFGFQHDDKFFSYDFLKISDFSDAISDENISWISSDFSHNNAENNFCIDGKNFSYGEIIEFQNSAIQKNAMKFSFDTFYIDDNSVASSSGFLISDRKILSESGFLTFVLEEDLELRTISGHIFIDSRGVVASQEVVNFHKHILKIIRMNYENIIAENPHIERLDLVKNLRQETAKYIFAWIWKTPIIMPIITYKKNF